MKKESSSIILLLSVTALGVAVYLGLDAQEGVWGMAGKYNTHWGKIVLSGVFGFGGVGGIWLYLNNMSNK